MATVDERAHRFDTALARFKQSLQIKLAVLPADHPLIGHTYSNMGLLYAKQKNWIDAHGFYDKAIALQHKSLPPTHPDLAVTYANKARVFIEEKQFNHALQLYGQALEIQLKRIPLCASHLANIYEQIGLIHIYMGDYAQALRSCEKALQCELDCHASWDQLCSLHNNMGTAHYKSGDYLRALGEYEIALDLIPSFDRSSKRFSTLNNIATTHLSMENHSMALHFYQQLIDALDQADVIPSDISLIPIYQNIGICYLDIEDYDLALEYFARVISLTENPSILSKTHSYVANALLAKDDFANAVENFELALKYDSSNEDFVIMAHNSIGNAHHLSGDIDSALCSYRQALDIQLATHSNDRSTLAALYGNIASVYWQAGALTEAIDHYTKQLEFETDADVKRQVAEDIEHIRHSL